MIWYPLAGFVGGGLRRRPMVSARIFVWEKAALPVLTLTPDTSFPPHMSLVPFKLLPQHWSSERMSLSPLGPLSGTPGTPEALHLT